jgi:hypothetical protein
MKKLKMMIIQKTSKEFWKNNLIITKDYFRGFWFLPQRWGQKLRKKYGYYISKTKPCKKKTLQETESLIDFVSRETGPIGNQGNSGEPGLSAILTTNAPENIEYQTLNTRETVEYLERTAAERLEEFLSEHRQINNTEE